MVVKPSVKEFFAAFETNVNTFEIKGFASQYADSFMFAQPQGVVPTNREDFLRVLPKRREFVKAVGLTSRTVASLEESKLDEHYRLVNVQWNMRFEKDGKESIDDKISATYILYEQNGSLQIVFQLAHQDLLKRVRDLGWIEISQLRGVN